MAGPNVGFATLSVIPSARGFRSKLNSELAGPMDAAGKESGSRFGKAFGLASKAAMGGAVAAIGIGVKSLMDFTGFERQMNEVFTLLPDLSADAMGQMQKDVKSFASEFGVLPNEVIPALYQSISAGVTQDNVFAFLETAQKAAKGGVTELATAVDGISSVVNAYGSDVISATEASDLMFTAVKLGKTDFEQLSASLFQVTPTAAGLGVQFEDVTAALAALTAQGVPTSVATTQMRQLFVELSKDGGAAAKVFEEMAGKTFSDFVKEGGNTAEALWLMQKAADDSGVAIQDMFGSVEAGSAALALSGNKAFTDGLDAMAASAGATQTAFDQMETGLGPIIDKIRARLSVASISIGEWLAPRIEDAMESLGNWWSRNGDTIRNAFEAVTGVLARGAEVVGGAIYTGFKLLSDWWGDNGEALIAGLKAIGDSALAAISSWWDNHGEKVTGGIQAIGDVINDPVIPAMQALFDIVKDDVLPKIGELYNLIRNNEYVLVGLAAAAGTVLVAAFYGWASAASAAAAATLLAMGSAVLAHLPIVLIGLAIGALAAGLYYAYENWEWFRTGVDGAADALEGIVRWLKSAHEWVLKVIEGLERIDRLNIVNLPSENNPLPGAGPSIGDLFGWLPDFDSGGIMPGPRGEHSLAWVAGGETILPTHRDDFDASSVGRGGAQITNVFERADGLDEGAVARIMAWQLAGR